MARGFDCAFSCTTLIPKIKAAGVDFVERYIGVGSEYKRLARPEAQALRTAGIDIVSVVEEWAAESEADQLRFTFASGQQMAQAAIEDATLLGQPHGSAIYFAVDGDVIEPRLSANVVPFFKGIAATFDEVTAIYRIGAYGSGLVGHTLASMDLIDLFQIANAHGWSGYAQYVGTAHLVQGKTGDLYGFGHGRAVDADASVGDFGGWAKAA